MACVGIFCKNFTEDRTGDVTESESPSRVFALAKTLYRTCTVCRKDISRFSQNPIMDFFLCVLKHLESCFLRYRQINRRRKMDFQFWLGFPAGEKSPKKVKVFFCRRIPAKMKVCFPTAVWGGVQLKFSKIRPSHFFFRN